jgi:hypothetical protein
MVNQLDKYFIGDAKAQPSFHMKQFLTQRNIILTEWKEMSK